MGLQPAVRHAVAGAPERVERLLAAAVLLAVAAMYAVRIARADFDYVLWTDRDLYRADELLHDLPVTGPEISAVGGRLPGGFLYVLLRLVLVVSDDPAGVYRVVTALEALGFAVLGVVVARRAGWLAGAVACACAATTPALLTSVERLWNPSLLPPLAVLQLLAAWAAAERRPAAGAVLLGLVTALAAQVHASALLLGAGLLAGVGLARTGGAGRTVLLALAGLLLGYLPYLLVEALHGWPNTRALLAPRGDGPLTAPRWVTARGLLAQVVFGAFRTAEGVPWTNVLHVGLLGTGAALLRGRGAGVRPLVTVAAAGVAVFPVFYGLLGGPTFTEAWEGRYVLVAVPLFAALLGLGWAELLGRAPPSRARPALAVLVGLSAAAVPVGVALHERPRSYESWAELERVLAAVRAETGWALQDVAGRTSVWTYTGTSWASRSDRGIRYLLHEHGQSFPGSLDAPCALVAYDAPRDGPADAAWVAEVLGQELPGLSVLRERRIDAHTRVVVYTTTDPCPASYAQRYVLRPSEEQLLQIWPTLAAGSVVELPMPDRRRLAGRMPLGPYGYQQLGVVVDLKPGPGRLRAGLRGGQLRGHAYNDGLMGNAQVRAPRLVLTEGDRVVAVPWAEGIVGGDGALVPLDADAVVPPGRWAVDLVLETVPEDGGTGREVRLHLLDELPISG